MLEIISMSSWLLRLNLGARASHHLTFMCGFLTISHTCPPCLPSERTQLSRRCLLVAGREVSLKRWKSSEMGRWERCMSGVRWKCGRIVRTIVRWYVRRGGKKVMRWQLGKSRRVVSREGGWNLRTKLCYIAPENRNVSRDSLQRLPK